MKRQSSINHWSHHEWTLYHTVPLAINHQWTNHWRTSLNRLGKIGSILQASFCPMFLMNQIWPSHAFPPITCHHRPSPMLNTNMIINASIIYLQRMLQLNISRPHYCGLNNLGDESSWTMSPNQPFLTIESTIPHKPLILPLARG